MIPVLFCWSVGFDNGTARSKINEDKSFRKAELCNKLDQCSWEKAELQRKIVLLDDENLTQVIGNNKECQDALVKLGPLPVHGAKVED